MLIRAMGDVPEQTVVSEGTTAAVRPLLGTAQRGDAPHPQSLAIRFLRRGDQARAHFHVVDQYQVFIDGFGRVGSHRVSPVTVHYTDRQTPYGPLVAESEGGFTYLTLRMHHDTGMRPMPESRSERIELGGRHLVVHIDPDAAERSDVEQIIVREDDGLYAATATVGPGESADTRVEPAPFGQQIVVLKGEVVHEGRPHPAWSVIALDANEELSEVVGGAEGAVVLALHFPDPARPPRRVNAVERTG